MAALNPELPPPLAFDVGVPGEPVALVVDPGPALPAHLARAMKAPC